MRLTIIYYCLVRTLSNKALTLEKNILFQQKIGNTDTSCYSLLKIIITNILVLVDDEKADNDPMMSLYDYIIFYCILLITFIKRCIKLLLRYTLVSLSI